MLEQYKATRRVNLNSSYPKYKPVPTQYTIQGALAWNSLHRERREIETLKEFKQLLAKDLQSKIPI